jgi:uncharacterized membrane protein YeaQ/YmgE (transglycosylase-associated protein family)
VLFAACGQQDKEIAAVMAITPKKVSRWRKRFLALGVAGLEKDAPRPGRKPKIGPRLTKRVVTMTTRQQPINATHWSTRTMAAAVGISEASVRRIWRAHGLKPHRVATFKISNDPQFAEKLSSCGPSVQHSKVNVCWKEGYMLHWLWVVLIGLVIGALAKFIMPGKDPGGYIVTALLGIAGSVAATWVGRAGWLVWRRTIGRIHYVGYRSNCASGHIPRCEAATRCRLNLETARVERPAPAPGSM